MPKTAFSPAQHGFFFANAFENVIVKDSPFGRIATRGRCGGMAFAALDHFYSGMPLPRFATSQLPESGVPPDNHPLSRYIYARQIDSFMVLSAAKYVTWSLSPDNAGFLIKGVSRWTKEDEWKKLRASIDIGKPVVLGLIGARDLAELGKNHQVIAFGYDESLNKESRIVHIYDVNYPNRELRLHTDSHRTGWIEDSPNLEQWRGWFVQDYAPLMPPSNLALPIAVKRVIAARRQMLADISVRFERLIFHNPDQTGREVAVALEFDVEGESWRWPRTGTRQVTDGMCVRLGRVVELAVPKDGALNISVRLSRELAAADLPGYDAFEFFNLDNDARAGEVRRQFTAAERWGKGAHSVRSSGEMGGFTVEFMIL